MPWELIDAAVHADATLELYAKDGVFMIRANGLELMNGFAHDSETAFGHLAGTLAPNAAPRVLIAGLGLGYTLAAASAALAGRGAITVVEFSPAVIRWFARHVRPSVLPEMPRHATIVEADAIAHLRSGVRYDLILLDIDNGPEPFTRESNASLYDPAGLALLRGALEPGGSALLWSGFQSDAFEAPARDAGFAVARRAIANGPRRALDHHIYVLKAL